MGASQIIERRKALKNEYLIKCENYLFSIILKIVAPACCSRLSKLPDRIFKDLYEALVLYFLLVPRLPFAVFNIQILNIKYFNIQILIFPQ